MPSYRQKDKEDQGEGKASGSKAQACLCHMDSDMLFFRQSFLLFVVWFVGIVTEIRGRRDGTCRLARMKRWVNDSGLKNPEATTLFCVSSMTFFINSSLSTSRLSPHPRMCSRSGYHCQSRDATYLCHFLRFTAHMLFSLHEALFVSCPHIKYLICDMTLLSFKVNFKPT